METMKYTAGTSNSSPAAATLHEVLAPYLKDDVMALEGISVPGSPFNLWADLLLIGEYETVAVALGDEATDAMSGWAPEYALGLVTDVFTVPASELFFHLDDVAYMISQANPSLFSPDAGIELSRRASSMIRRALGTTHGNVVPVIYPVKDRFNLDIQRFSTIHGPQTTPSDSVLAA